MWNTHRTLIGAVVLSAAFVCIPPNIFAESATPAITVLKDFSTERPAIERAAAMSNGNHPSLAEYREFAHTKVGETSEREEFTLVFHEAAKVTGISASADFHVNGGSCGEGHTYMSGDECTVEVEFTPQGPGHRTGKLTVAHTASAEPLTVPMGGDSEGPAVSFIPAEITTVPGTFVSSAGLLLSPQALAVDGGDNLYMVDTGHNLIRYRDSSGTITTIAGGGTNAALNYSGFATSIKLNGPSSVALDHVGNAYIADQGDSLVIPINLIDTIGTEIGGGTESAPFCNFTSPCDPSTEPLNPAYSLALDPNDNLFLSLNPEGSPAVGVQLWEDIVSTSPSGLAVLDGGAASELTSDYPLAVDASDNLYLAFEVPLGSIPGIPAQCYIMGENEAASQDAPGAASWIIAGTRTCGFSGDGGLATGAEIGSSVQGFALDAAGNFYFTDTNNQRVRRIDALTGIIHTIAGTGTAGYTADGGEATIADIHSPTGLAVDSKGNVYLTSLEASTGSTAVVREVGIQGELLFVAQALSTPSATETILVSNTGNGTLNFAHIGLSSGNTGDFAIDPNTTTCLTSTPLLSGQNCYVGVIFTPQALGTRTAIITLADNTVAGSNLIVLNGLGVTPATPVLSPTSLTFVAQATGTTSPSQAVTLTNTGGVTLTITSFGFTGTNAAEFGQTHTCATTLAAGLSCTISVTFSPTLTGTATAALSVVTASGTVTAALTGTGATPAKAAMTPPTLTFTSQAAGTTSASQALTLTNSGGVALTINSYTFSGTNPTYFAQTNTCAATLAAGLSCTINVKFAPTAAGSPSATLTVVTTGGTVASTMTGTATAAVVKAQVKLTSEANAVAEGRSVELIANVSGGSAGVPTGTVQLRQGTTLMATSTLVGGSATFVTKLPVGLHTLTAYYLGDKEHSAAQSGTVEVEVSGFTLTAPHAVIR